jgi:hypothetical protein
MLFELPTIVTSLDGQRAIELRGLVKTQRQRNWDASFYEAELQSRPVDQPTRVLVAVSGSFAATWRHPSQTLGWHVPLEDALPGLAMVELGNMMDNGEVPLELVSADDVIINITSYSVFERPSADDEAIYSFIKGHVYWSWRFGLPVARFTLAEAARLGTSVEELSRLSFKEEGILWQSDTSGVKALPALVRDFEAGRPVPASTSPAPADRYEVALSFAGDQRDFVREVANILRDTGVSVFFDEFHQADLWGRDLASLLGEVYGDRSRYIVIFCSRAYLDKPWTEHERQHALSGRIKRMDSSVLPVRMDGSSLPGLPDSVAYVDARSMAASQVADLILRKLQRDSNT